MITTKEIRKIIQKYSEGGLWINQDELYFAIKECCKIHHEKEIRKMEIKSIKPKKRKARLVKVVGTPANDRIFEMYSSMYLKEFEIEEFQRDYPLLYKAIMISMEHVRKYKN